MSPAPGRPKKGSALQAAASRDATPLRAVQVRAGGLGAAALSPLGGTARSAKGAPCTDPARVERIDAVLPQTQCTRCGYADCRAYAEAVADGQAINRCPPGGAEGIARLAAITGMPRLPLDPECGVEGPLRLARIDEAWCIGCTLCIDACPVDCIVGAPKQMHTVIAGDCTGCELCLPACPVDCIELVVASGARSGWAAWSPAQAEAARLRHLRRNARLAAAAAGVKPEPAVEHKRSLVGAALARARARPAG